MSHNEAIPQDPHVARAKQIAEAIDSPDREQTLYEQFHAEFKAWESEDQTRTMADFNRAIGRSENYTQRIVRFVTGPPRAGTPWESGSNKRDDVAKTVLRDRPQDIVNEIAAALEDPDVAHAVVEAATARGRQSIDTAASTVNYLERREQTPHTPPAGAASHQLGGIGPGALSEKLFNESMEPMLHSMFRAGEKAISRKQRHGFRMALTELDEFQGERDKLVQLGQWVAELLDDLDAAETAKQANEREGAQR